VIEGEAGTGKKLVAEAIHGYSSRSDKPYDEYTCTRGAKRDEVIRSLFGTEAYTGISRTLGKLYYVKDGTLLIDELQYIPISLHDDLLRLIEEGQYQMFGGHEWHTSQARLLFAVNRPFQELYKKRLIDAGLYSRLWGYMIHLPPLRERIEDIPLLVDHFIRQFAPSENIKISSDAIDKLQSFDWKGLNVRGLKRTIDRAISYLRAKRINVITAELIKSLLSSYEYENSSLTTDLWLIKNLNERQQLYLKAFKGKSFTTEDCRKLIKEKFGKEISKRQINRDLRELVDRKLVNRIGKTKGASYVLSN